MIKSNQSTETNTRCMYLHNENDTNLENMLLTVMTGSELMRLEILFLWRHFRVIRISSDILLTVVESATDMRCELLCRKHVKT